jgi:hypothetical protein
MADRPRGGPGWNNSNAAVPDLIGSMSEIRANSSGGQVEQLWVKVGSLYFASTALTNHGSTSSAGPTWSGICWKTRKFATTTSSGSSPGTLATVAECMNAKAGERANGRRAFPFRCLTRAPELSAHDCSMAGVCRCHGLAGNVSRAPGGKRPPATA